MIIKKDCQYDVINDVINKETNAFWATFIRLFIVVHTFDNSNKNYNKKDTCAFVGHGINETNLTKMMITFLASDCISFHGPKMIEQRAGAKIDLKELSLI